MISGAMNEAAALSQIASIGAQLSGTAAAAATGPSASVVPTQVAAVARLATAPDADASREKQSDTVEKQRLVLKELDETLAQAKKPEMS